MHNYGNTDTDALGDMMASEGSLNLMQSHHLSYGSFILIQELIADLVRY